MKELFTEYQQQMTGSNAEFIDDEYHFQKWVEEQVDNDGWTEELEEQYWKEQCPDPFLTPEELAAPPTECWCGDRDRCDCVSEPNDNDEYNDYGERVKKVEKVQKKKKKDAKRK
jgi:hypothetical protein